MHADTVIDAPAEAVWEVLAHRFGEIAEWASIMKSSEPIASTSPGLEAPVSGRVCTAYGFGKVQENLLDYDEQNMQFKYEAVRGLPFFIRYAENNWTVKPLSGNQCQVQSTGVLRMDPITATLLFPLFKYAMQRVGDRLFKDLKQYVEGVK